MEGLETLIGGLFVFVIILFVLAIAIYVLYSIFLNKFHKLLYGKGTAAAWIPIANCYVLGKVTFNKNVGWVLVALSLLSGEFTYNVNGVEKTISLLPSVVNSLISIGFFGLFIYAIIKYNNVKKEINMKNYMNGVQNSGVQPMQPDQVVQPVQPVQTNQVIEPVQSSMNNDINQGNDNSSISL